MPYIWDAPSKEHCDSLREQYVKAKPYQRLKVARDLLQKPECLPNRLIVVIAAIEALARSICLNRMVAAGNDCFDAYKSVRYSDPAELVEKILDGAQEPFFSAIEIQNLELAVEYRNLIVHEATFLREGFMQPLLEIIEAIFKRLEELAGTHKSNQVGGLK